MSNLITIHNLETNEVIVREMTNKELEQREKDAAEAVIEAERKENAKAAKAAAEAKLTALGLTLDDLRALGLA
jgi:membrane protein required for beta-lactamase induction